MSDPSGVPDPALEEKHDKNDLLAAISRAMVGNLKEYFGKGPIKAKTYLMDDFCLVITRGGALAVEETMIAAGREDSVRQFRQDFQNEMAERLIGTIEQLAGRKVLTYQSQVLFEPHIVCELFFFEDALDSHLVNHTLDALKDPGRGVASFGDGDQPN